MALMQHLIRPAAAGDAQACAAIYRPIVETTTISFEESAPDAAEFERRIAEITRAYPWLVAQTPAGVAGYAYASRHRERSAYRYSVDVCVYVAERARRQGIAASLYGALFASLSERGFHRAFAGIALPNEASLRVHERFGFEPVGVYKEAGWKFGKWLDVYWCQKALSVDGRPVE